MFARLLMFSVMRTMVDGIAVYRIGSGGPTVVYLPGAGLVGLDYLNLTGVPGATHVLYDRGGTGWSEPIELPRSAAAVATELRAVLGDGPFVLVGHSMGAIYARRFAQLFPDDVAGLLLLDPGHEDLFDYLPPEAAALNEQMKPTDLPDLTPEQITAATAAYEKLLAEWPGQTRAELIEQHLTQWRTGLAEAANLESEIYDEVRHGGPVPDVPAIVLTAGGGNPVWSSVAPPEMVKQALDGIDRLHATIAASFTRGEHRRIDGASHQFLHIEQPEPVRAALRDLLRPV